MEVALRKESVDRNFDVSLNYKEVLTSLSARRAWIEIQVFQRIAKPFRSLSARRAWIEIPALQIYWLLALVALRKESVDRNPKQPVYLDFQSGRSPQGERG